MMDVEGAELPALRGAWRTLAGERPPRMLIEFHGDQFRYECLSMLANVGCEFQTVPARGPDAIGNDRRMLRIPRTKMKLLRDSVKVAPTLSL